MKIKLGAALKYTAGLIFLCVIGLIYFKVKEPTELRRFRRTDHAFARDLPNPPSRQGLEQLNASGSARISRPALQKNLKDITKSIYVFDMLAEPHCFIQGLPAHWYGYDPAKLLANTPSELSLSQIRYILRRLLKTGRLTHTNQDVQTEKQMIENAGYHHVEVYFKRGDTPLDEQVDQLVSQLRSLPENSWAHFHCSAGQGRTTIGMTMLDILKNGKNLPLETIIERQFRLGGVDLFDTTVWKNGTYTQEALKTRKDFISKFYQYVIDPKGLDSTSWKEWIKINN